MPKRSFPAAAILTLSMLAACAPRREPPAPIPPPAPPAPPVRPAPPPPAPLDWQDAPLAAGDWSLEADSASYGPPGAPAFIVRCEQGRVALVRMGSVGNALTIRTSYGERSLAADRRQDGLAATLAADDPLLDAMVFSRGRFAVQAGSEAPLIVPSWPEPARVIEECRG